MVIIPSYLTIYLRCSASRSLDLSLCYLVSSLSSFISVSRVRESPGPSRLVSNCIDIDVRLSYRCCRHPCFTNPFILSTLLSPVSRSLCFRCALCFFFLSLFVSYRVNLPVGCFAFQFSCFQFSRSLILLRSISSPPRTDILGIHSLHYRSSPARRLSLNCGHTQMF